MRRPTPSPRALAATERCSEPYLAAFHVEPNRVEPGLGTQEGVQTRDEREAEQRWVVVCSLPGATGNPCPGARPGPAVTGYLPPVPCSRWGCPARRRRRHHRAQGWRRMGPRRWCWCSSTAPATMREYLGTRARRVCSICQRREDPASSVTFRKTAHLMPEMLGNPIFREVQVKDDSENASREERYRPGLRDGGGRPGFGCNPPRRPSRRGGLISRASVGWDHDVVSGALALVRST